MSLLWHKGINMVNRTLIRRDKVKEAVHTMAAYEAACYSFTGSRWQQKTGSEAGPHGPLRCSLQYRGQNRLEHLVSLYIHSCTQQTLVSCEILTRRSMLGSRSRSSGWSISSALFHQYGSLVSKRTRCERFRTVRSHTVIQNAPRHQKGFNCCLNATVYSPFTFI